MRVEDVTIEVRDLALTRVGEVDPTFWSDVLLEVELNGPGHWSMTLPAEDPVVQALALPGAGIVVNGPDGQLFSGPVEPFSREQTQADVQGMIAFQGVSDSALLWDVPILPNPAVDANAQTLDAYVVTGAAETVLHTAVNAQIGPGAIAAQRGALADLIVMGADLGRGSSRTLRSRFDVLGEKLAELAKLDGLGFRIVQVDDGLEFQTYAARDMTGYVRFDMDNDTLARISYEVAPPGVTDVLVAGQGEGADRQIIVRNSVESLAAADEWGRRKRVWKDQRNTDVTAELQQAGDELLAESGFTQALTKLIPADTVGELEYGRDWLVGDRVAVVIGDTEVETTVTGAVIAIGQSGVLVGARIG